MQELTNYGEYIVNLFLVTHTSVVKQKRTVGDCMCATSVGRVDTKEKNVENRELVPKRPKYLERSVWTDVEVSPSYSPTAWGTLMDDPLLRPPPQEFANLDAVTTIHENPHLFRLVTPMIYQCRSLRRIMGISPERSVCGVSLY